FFGHKIAAGIEPLNHLAEAVAFSGWNFLFGELAIFVGVGLIKGFRRAPREIASLRRTRRSRRALTKLAAGLGEFFLAHGAVTIGLHGRGLFAGAVRQLV